MFNTDIFIKRPVYAGVVSLFILAIGIIGFQKLSVRQYPLVTPTVATVTTTYTGTTGSDMESLVTTVLEQSLGTIDGIDNMISTSEFGTSTITITFAVGTDVNSVMAEVISHVDAVTASLPSDLDSIVALKVDPNASPTLYIGLQSESDAVSQSDVLDYVVNVVQPTLESVSGAGQVNILSGSTYSIRHYHDPLTLQAHNLTLSDVVSGVITNNTYMPSGSIFNSTNRYDIQMINQPNDVASFSRVAINNVNGDITYLSDIARVDYQPNNIRSGAKVNNKPVVMIGVVPATEANPVQLSKDIRAQIENLKAGAPSGLVTDVFWDVSDFINKSIEEVYSTLYQAVLIVMAVILCLLGSLRLIIVPCATIPLSLIGVFALMHHWDFTLNSITLLAIVLAIGMVVDDAIVVLENVHRHLEMGKTPRQAALEGAREIVGPVIVMTLTLAAVYAPIGFMSGVTGVLFEEFAFTLAGSVVLSGIIALTLSPMMCSKIMTKDILETAFAKRVNHIFETLSKQYHKIIETLCNKFKTPVLIGFVGALLSTGWMFTTLPSELVPYEDPGVIIAPIIGPSDASYAYMTRALDKAYKVFESVPEKTKVAFISGYPTISQGLGILKLTDWDDRKRDLSSIIFSMFPKLAMIPDALILPLNPFSVPGVSGYVPIEFVVRFTQDYKELYPQLMQFLGAAAQNPMLTNVHYDLQYNKPRFDYTMDQRFANQLGITSDDIGTALRLALSENWNEKYIHKQHQYEIIAQLDVNDRSTVENIKRIPLRTLDGSLVPLGDLVTFSRSPVPNGYYHFQQLRSVTLSASLAPGFSQGDALTWLTETSQKIFPAGTQFDTHGQLRAYVQSAGQMLPLFIDALIFIYLVLSVQYNSFRDPILILMTVPCCLFGALGLLKLTGASANIYTQLAMVTLVGLISKHGILMVDFANNLRDENKKLSRMDAIIEAATTRLRPILATTAAMVMAAVPLVIATGPGSAARTQMGQCIVGGMVVGTVLSLFVLPVIYTLFAPQKRPCMD